MGRVFFLFVLLLVLGAWGSMFFSDQLFGMPLPDELNALGDSFGAVNALFSGLGFAGIVYSLYLQRTEIDKAAGQIDTQREAIERLTESLTRQSDLLGRSAEAQRVQAEQTALLVGAYESHLPHLERSADATERHARTTETSSLSDRLDRLLDEFRSERAKVAERLAKANLTIDSSQDEAKEALGEPYRTKLLEVLDRASELPEDLSRLRMRSLKADLSESEKLALLCAEFHDFYGSERKPLIHSALARGIKRHSLIGMVKQMTDGPRLTSYLKAPDD